MSDLSDRLDSLVSDETARLAYKHESAVSAFTNGIALRMREEDVSQSELARRLGVSRARVSQLLQHRSSPTVRTMVEVAAALGCDVGIRVIPADPDPPDSASATEEGVPPRTAAEHR